MQSSKRRRILPPGRSRRTARRRSRACREIRKICNIEEKFEAEGIDAVPTIVWHDTVSNGIAYAELFWDLTTIPERLVPYLGVFRTLLGSVDTEHYTYLALSNEINIETGGLSSSVGLYDDFTGRQPYIAVFSIRMKALFERLGAGFDLIREVIATSQFTDEKRIREVLLSTRARLENALQTSGSATAMSRANAYFSAAGAFQDYSNGVSFYRTVKDLAENFEERKADLIAAMNELMRLVFDPSKLIVSYTSDPEGHEYLKKELPKVLKGFSKNENPQHFVSPLGHLLSYGYLWQNVRVKGGAYGVSTQFRRAGEGYFASYRDPNLAGTFDVFRSVPDYIASFTADEKEMTRYIIGTMSAIDTPLTPSLFGAISMRSYMNGLSDEAAQKARNQILDATDETIRSLADSVREVVESGYICVVGSETAVEKEKALFNHIEPLV